MSVRKKVGPVFEFFKNRDYIMCVRILKVSIMNTTTITPNSINKFNQVTRFLNSKNISFLLSTTSPSIIVFTKSSLQTSRLLKQLLKGINLNTPQPSYALAA